jgi:serine/threonine-protein kinase HipA
VGELAEERGRAYFEEAADFVARGDGMNLSPFRLPFQAGLFEHTDVRFGALPGVFDDSLPDGWGLLLMDRHFAARGVDVRAMSPLERLSWLGTRTMGALTYHPPTVREEGGGGDGVFDLHDLARESERVLSGEAGEVLPELLRAGGSPAGARPKVLVGVKGKRLVSGEDELPEGFEHWLVKFSAKGDGADAGAVEFAYGRMAVAAGLTMPTTRLFETKEGGRFFGVRRFDREKGRRLHVHTFGNLIQSNFRIPSCDYVQLMQVTSLLTRNHQDVLRAFRQMVFNVVAHNRDDHVKNFAFVLEDERGEWRLSPAYDLCWAAGPGGEHTMTVAGEGRAPGVADFQRVAEGAGISKKEVGAIVEEVREAMGKWRRFAEKAGVRRKRVREIEATFPEV